MSRPPNTPDAAFCAALADPDLRHLGLAVSGGGDSMAMLYLAADFARARDLTLHCVTVDHGLRPQAADEAAVVAQACKALSIPHTVLRWTGWDGQGNLMAEARKARYALMAQWARENDLQGVALAHTMDDQAETFLMGLARRAGIDGVSGMPVTRDAFDMTWLRPLLSVSRAALRSDLQARAATWCEDPTNDDPQFERVRVRQALPHLAELGITPENLAAVAGYLRSARQALDVQTAQAAKNCVHQDRGDLRFDSAALAKLPDEIARRLTGAALRWVSGTPTLPRSDAMAEFVDAVMAGKAASLHGCLAVPVRAGVQITREFNAVRDLRTPVDALWDGRWRLKGPEIKGAELRALGAQGLSQSSDWRATDLPRASLLASPSVWQGENLIAAPLAGLENGWQVGLATQHLSFDAFVISH